MLAQNNCVLVKKFFDGDLIMVLLYVVDILIVGNDINKIKNLKTIWQVVSKKDQGTNANANKKLWLSQEKYSKKVFIYSTLVSVRQSTRNSQVTFNSVSIIALEERKKKRKTYELNFYLQDKKKIANLLKYIRNIEDVFPMQSLL